MKKKWLINERPARNDPKDRLAPYRDKSPKKSNEDLVVEKSLEDFIEDD